jgi:phosphatidylglycerophosphatase A
LSTWKKALVSFGGLGYLPIAPGTWGSGGAAVAYSAVRLAGVNDPVVLGLVCGGIAAVFTLVTAALGKWAEGQYGRKDPGAVVTDEVAGYFLSVILFVNGPWWVAALGGFVFFRFFDIVKLPPANLMERIRGGWGIALDDLVAGIYACACNNALVLVAVGYGIG